MRTASPVSHSLRFGGVVRNGTLWTDAAGAPIQAHGGWVLPHDGAYYWYGEDKSGVTRNRRMDVIGIRCYRSDDLVAWHDQGLVLASDPSSELDVLRPSGVMERPRALFCKATGKFVMWFHADDPSYRAASVGVAVSEAPNGPFELLRVMRPNNQDSRDLTLFEDADGTAYLVHSSESNRSLHIARLTPDYEDVDGSWSRAFADQDRESPCVLRANGQYYLLTSGCTGWRPNPALFGTSPRVVGGWKLIDNPCRGPRSHTTFDGQATCVFWASGRPYALVDHWNPDDLGASGYSILPVSFAAEKHDPMEICWHEEFLGVGMRRKDFS